MSRKSSGSSISPRHSKNDNSPSHYVNEVHEEASYESVSRTTKVTQIDVQPAPEEAKYVVPAESNRPRPNPKTPLPMPEHTVKEKNPQTAFDFNLDSSKEVIAHHLDLENRDRNGVNKDLKVKFLDIFAEPDPEYHSVACVWTCSYRVFEITRIYCYKILTLILGLPIVFIAGLVFALFTFARIWIVQPTFTLVRIVLAQILIIWSTAVIYVCRPFFYSVGAVFSTFRLHRTDGPIIQEVWEHV
ncbi:hypothetical protein RB195_014965 [Necator americanus]|uniref:Caveolin n=1 Tax=Necator americanus TaxID=51031 RepID=A0ABR1E2I6_NECAM